MVKHVVCYKLKEGNAPERSKEILLSMQGKIDAIEAIEVGIDFLYSPRSYDLVLSVAFADRESMQRYQEHEYHVSVVKQHMHSVVEKSVSVDYETA